jgi:hypothetical protein
MRLYSDRPDIQVPGRWYRCQPGAQTVGWTAFFARRNELQDKGDYPLGEVYQRGYAYSKTPANPQLKGTSFCGSPSAWQNGVPYSAGTLPVGQNGIPLCCGITPKSTLLLGGKSARVLIGQGGLVLSGGKPPPLVVSGNACGCGTITASVSTFT